MFHPNDCIIQMSFMFGWNVSSLSFNDRLRAVFRTPDDRSESTSTKDLGTMEEHGSGPALHGFDTLRIDQLHLGSESQGLTWATSLLSEYGPQPEPYWQQEMIEANFPADMRDEVRVMRWIEYAHLRPALCAAIFLYKFSINKGSEMEKCPDPENGTTVEDTSSSGEGGRPDRSLIRQHKIFGVAEAKTSSVCMAGRGEERRDILENISRYCSDWPSKENKDPSQILSVANSWQTKARQFVYQVSLVDPSFYCLTHHCTCSKKKGMAPADYPNMHAHNHCQSNTLLVCNT